MSSEHLGPVIDKSGGGGYPKGEEGLVRGWRPRRESLIVEHREQLLKLHMIEEVSYCMCSTSPDLHCLVDREDKTSVASAGENNGRSQSR